MIIDIDKYSFKHTLANENSHIIENIFNTIGTTNKFFVEFGFRDHPKNFDNTKYLRALGWNGVWLDSIDHISIKETEKNFTIKPKSKDVKIETVTAENVNQLFFKYGVPMGFDLLCINSKPNDFWIWKALHYTPSVVIMKYNPYISNNGLSKVIPYNPDYIYNGTTFYGASFKAVLKLGKEKGYSIVGCSPIGHSLFFVKEFLIDGNFKVTKDINSFFRPPLIELPNDATGQLIKY